MKTTLKLGVARVHRECKLIKEAHRSCGAVNAKPSVFSFAASLILIAIALSTTPVAAVDSWGTFRRCEAVVIKVDAATNSAVFTVTPNTTNPRAAVKRFDAYLGVRAESIWFTPEHRPKSPATIADLHPGLRVILTGTQSTSGSFAREVLIPTKAK